MDWVRIDVDFFDHPKVLGLVERAQVLYLRGLLYCGKHETDWVVPAAFCSKAKAKPLVDAGLWEPLQAGGWHIRNAEDRQPDLEHLNAVRAIRAEQGRKGGLAKARAIATAKARANAVANGQQISSTVTVTDTVGITSLLSLGTRVPANGDKTSRFGVIRLVDTIARSCIGENRGLVEKEAQGVVAWAAQHVDPRIIEEAVGWANLQANKPVLPRAIAAVIEAKARDHGIITGAFRP